MAFNMSLGKELALYIQQSRPIHHSLSLLTPRSLNLSPVLPVFDRAVWTTSQASFGRLLLALVWLR